jgi:single-stranded-DNA-specific exonuclease
MISVSGKNWFERKVNKNLVEKIRQDFKFSKILSRLISLRNFDNSEINNICNKPKIYNIFVKNPDFNKACEVLINVIRKNENICILGDYDVDGASATSLFARYFNHIKHPYFYYIPDREKDGYGASKKIFQKLVLKKPKLIIMVDCGSTSNEAIEFLNQNNIKSIIIDHHDINKPFPKSNVIINPKKDNGYKEYDYFCATALSYFFIDILIKKNRSDFKLNKFLIYVLLATICDVMPLRKINKIIASNVIENYDIKNNVAFKSIFEQLDIKRRLTVDDLGFLIGPIINSGGRLGHSNYGTDFMTSDNLSIINQRTIDLIKLNDKRKKIEQDLLNDIDFKEIKNQNKNVIIYYNTNINEGLIGIIAAKLKDHFNKPSIVITQSNNILKGSARSTANYNLGYLMKILVDKKIIIKGGGHNMAAGFVMKKNNLKSLDEFIQKDFSKKNLNRDISFKYDAELSSSAINKNFIDEINKLGPFGNYNHSPVFLIKDVKVIKSNVINYKHVSSLIKPRAGSTVKSICFNCSNSLIGKYLLSYKKKINVIAELNENIWNNKKTIQLNIKDLVL